MWIIYTRLQATILILLFLELAKLNKYTYEGPSSKSVFFQKALYNIHTPFIHVISSRECYWKCGSVRTMATFTHVYVHHFSGLG